MSIGATIHARLSADSTLTALLGTFNSEPCVFYPQVPDNAPRPYVVIDPPQASPLGLQNMKGKEVRLPEVAVHCFVDFAGSAVAVDSIAERVYDLLHANGRSAGLSTALTISGYNGVLTSVVNGPVQALTDDSLEGRTVVARVAIARET